MKKVLSIGLSICMAAALFGCSSGAGRDTAPQTTASAEADTTKAAGEEAENAESASGDTTAAETKAEASIDDYVYDGDPIEIHLGDINSQFPLNLAYNLGYLQEEFEGSNVTFTMDYFQNGPAISEAFASGDLDFAEFGEQAAIAGISADYGYKIIAATAIRKRCIRWWSTKILRTRRDSRGLRSPYPSVPAPTTCF